MPWWKILLLVIQYGPAVVELVGEIIDLTKKLKGQEKEAFKVELKRARAEYKISKRTEPIEELHARLKKRCSESGVIS